MFMGGPESTVSSRASSKHDGTCSTCQLELVIQ